MKRIKPLALVAAVLVALVALVSGCGGNDEAVNSPAMVEGTWNLVTLHGSAADATVPTTMSLNEGQATGNAGVNTFNGPYKAPSDGVLTFGTLASTMMAGPENAMKQEQDFLKALADTKKFTTDNGNLVLMDDNETKLAAFKPAGNG